MTAAQRALITVGGLVMGYAVVAAVIGSDADPVGLLLFLAGSLVVHDAVVLPLAIGVGALAGRFVPTAALLPVRVAALVTLAVTIVAAPLVLGVGRTADNPSVLPLPYGRGLALVLAAVWATAAACAAARWWRRRTRSLAASAPPPSATRPSRRIEP